MRQPNPIPRWLADLALGFIALIWGATFVMVKAALDSVGPATFIAWRFVTAGIALLLLFHHRMRQVSRAELLAGGVMGFWLGTGYILQTTGLQYTTTGKTGFITGLSVVIVPILAAILFRRPPAWPSILGILTATAGLGFLTLDENLQIQAGDLWVLGAAFGFALHIISVSHFAPRHDPLRLSVAQASAVAILATGAAFIFETPSVRLPATTWGAIIFTGVVATALVFSLQTAVQRFTTPTHAALIFSLEPVFAAFFGWLWAHEILGWKELIGCGLILAGIIASEIEATPLSNKKQAPDL